MVTTEQARLRKDLRKIYRDQSDHIQKFGMPSSNKNNSIEKLRRDLKRIDSRSVEADSKEIPESKAKNTHRRIIGVCVGCRREIYSRNEVYEYMNSWYCSRECRNHAADTTKKIIARECRE